MRLRPPSLGAVASVVLLVLLGSAVPVVVATIQSEQAGGEQGEPEATPAEEPRYRGTDTRRNLGRPLVDPPFDAARFPREVPAEVRGIRLEPSVIELVEGGRLMATLPFSGTQATLPEIAAAIDDPRWLAEVEPGVFELRAALLQTQGTTLVVQPPEVTELRLVDLPGMFLGGDRAHARLEGITVRSWDPSGRGPDTQPEDGRPFILYERGSRLDIVGSEISHLGSDRASAYGVSWRLGGATGRVVDSDFHHNFFGIYTFEAHGLEVRNSRFHHQLFYGVDPHDFSTGLVIEDNVAYANGSHGIIVSYGVTDSVIRRNHSYENHGNGIVIDDRSDRNVVTDNVVERNHGDGIVVLGSAHTTVEGNVIRDNRVGIRINNLNAVSTLVLDNLMEGNRVGVEAYRGAADLRLVDNVVRANTDTGLKLAAARTKVIGGRITGGETGIDVRSLVDVVDVSVAGVQRGVRVAPGSLATFEAIDVDAADVGVEVEEPADVSLRSSVVDAPLTIDGPVATAEGNQLSGSPFVQSWLPIAGVSVLAVAVSFEVLRSVRARGQPRRPQAPAAVWNTS